MASGYFLPAVLLMMSCAVFTGFCQIPPPKMCNLSITREPGRCIWYGQCMDDDSIVYGSKLNCFDNGPAREVRDMDDDYQRLLRDTCPQIWERGKTCCDSDMLHALSSQISFPRQLFSRCPACARNFIDHYCLMACDPDQSLYLNPTTCRSGQKNGRPFVAIANISVYLEKEYAENLYRSCENVVYPQGDARIKDLLCGGENPCSARLWLKYLGDPFQNHNSPFPMVYEIGSKPSLPEVQPKMYDFIPCDTTNSKYHCSTNDCHPSEICPPPPPKKHFPVMLNFTAVNSDDYIVFQPFNVFGVSNWTFGPVLSNAVLNEVLDIQEHLVKMKVVGNLRDGSVVTVTLQDICMKLNAPVNENCAVMSVLNYFQNNRTRLQHVETFGLTNNSYHIHYCTRDPDATEDPFMQEEKFSCLGDFGGPVDPHIALGGFSYWPNCFPNYQNATSLGVTFSFSSQANDQLIKIWEEGLVDYLTTPDITKYTYVSYKIEWELKTL